jgi:hypothetical protein
MRIRASSLCSSTATVALAIVLVCPAARAEDADASTDAARHFARGVSLYGETDYRGALVEFERAYATSPNLAVLYDIGETRFQLQDYAAALTTFERYLMEAAPMDARRAEVEGDMEVLRARVGHLSVVTTPPGVEVAVDDRVIGRTPLDAPILVSIGRRKIVATLRGRPPVTREVDIAAGDQAAVTIDVPDPALAAPPMPAPAPETHESSSARPSGGTAAWRSLGWFLTGISAAGAATFGVLALRASSDLQGARATYPTSPATLSSDARLATTYSIVADSLGAAAILFGGVTLYATLSPRHAPSQSGGIGAARVGVGPASARFEVTF